RPMVVVAVCLVTTFGLMGWLQPSIDMVTVLVAPIVCVVGLAAAVHVEMSFRRRLRERPDDVAAALDATYREKRWPIVWSGVTTAVGFGSLVAARVPPVRALGAWCTFGIALVTLALLTLQPALIRLRSARRARLSRYEAWAGPFGRRLVAAAMAQPGRVALGFTLATLVAAVGALRIDLGTNVLDYLPRGSPVRTGLEGLEAHGVGAMAVDLALALPATDGEGFRSPLLTARLGELSRDLRDEPHVLAALSYFELAGRGLESPAGSLLRAGRGLMISRDGSLTRVRLLVPMLGFSQLDPVLERAVARARRAFPEAEVWAGGDYVHVLEAQRSLLATMFVSLALTATIIALILFFLLGGGRRALAALLPNLLPPLLVVGLMGWLGMPLDSSTVMIGAVVLGLAVDDTLHTFGQYRLRVRSLPPAAAIEATYERVAPAHMLTSLVLAAGLGICGFADLRPISHFGALSAAAVAGALLGDLLLLPVLLRGRPRRAA
ncbi:MAG: MMPL family transporter, partial [Thermoanaerobaculia bacterium]|nr:MMPL family transporter [Thermoanaerobaculia bacterium]